jgi:hypothetical protein
MMRRLIDMVLRVYIAATVINYIFVKLGTLFVKDIMREIMDEKFGADDFCLCILAVIFAGMLLTILAQWIASGNIQNTIDILSSVTFQQVVDTTRIVLHEVSRIHLAGFEHYQRGDE